MTRSCRLRHAFGRPTAATGSCLAALAGLPAALAMLAGCAAAVPHVPLPPKPPVASVSTPSRRLPASPRQQVIAAYTGYTAALNAANKSEDAAMARSLLRHYVVASRVAGLVQAERRIWALGESFYGAPVLHIMTVHIDGRHAFVHDCDNTSGMGLERAATGQVVAGTAGVVHDNVVTRLNLVNGCWLVAFQIVEDLPCAP
jgi:hypothetical protein